MAVSETAAETTFGEGVVVLSRQEGIATVMLNRPGQHNALSSATWKGLGEAVAAADADPSVGVIVLRGAGQRAFSAGADIKEFETTRATEDGARNHQDTVQACLGALEAATKPIVAMIHGYCIGGGCEVALSADIRIADERAEIGIPSAKMGILLELGYIRRLVATVGPSNASLLLFTGQRFSAARALQMGLVSEVCRRTSWKPTSTRWRPPSGMLPRPRSAGPSARFRRFCEIRRCNRTRTGRSSGSRSRSRRSSARGYGRSWRSGRRASADGRSQPQLGTLVGARLASPAQPNLVYAPPLSPNRGGPHPQPPLPVRGRGGASAHTGPVSHRTFRRPFIPRRALMHLEEILDTAELGRLIAENYITARDHPALPYKILNYTPKTQFARHWTPETELSRGLMFDTRDGTIVGRAFKKFFNWGEREVAIPAEPFVAYEKMDGSLGISYVDADGQPSLATRGSFTSYQAKRATQILRSKYAHTLDAILALGRVTLCLEIILPEYRIVVDYEGREDLVLLAAFNTETGQEIDLDEPQIAALGFPMARRYPAASSTRPTSWWRARSSRTARVW